MGNLLFKLVAPDTTGKYRKRKGLKTGEEIVVKLYENVLMDKAFLGLFGGNQTNNMQKNNQQERKD